MPAAAKKTWTACSALQDHVDIMMNCPLIFKAAFTLKPKEGESLLLAANSANECPYCTELHGQLGRMAGLEDAIALNTMATAPESADQMQTDAEVQPFVRYGKLFCQNDGRGPCVKKEYESLVQSVGKSKAKCARAYGWFLLWGSMTGNTLNSFIKGTLRCKHKKGSNVIFEFFFALWYLVCFGLVVAVSFVLKFFPKVPPCLSTLFSAALAIVASIWIIPFGILGVITAPLRCGKVFKTLPGVNPNKVCAAPSSDSAPEAAPEAAPEGA